MMKWKLLQGEPEKTYAVVFDPGDEFVSRLTGFAREQKLAGSHFTAIGAFHDAVLGYFERDHKEYKRIPIQEQVEVLSLVGDIALRPDGTPEVHAHVVVGKSDGTAHGGHVLEAHVWPTLEVVIDEEPRHMQRRPNAATGLALIDLDAAPQR